MKVEITEQEFREAFIRECGKEPSGEIVRLALAFNEVLNNSEKGGAVNGR